jgi:hypothetical protein
MKSILRIAISITFVALLWEALYPDYYDPKNPHYVAWKYHLLPMDPRRALSIMPHDQASENLVLGKTNNNSKIALASSSPSIR